MGGWAGWQGSFASAASPAQGGWRSHIVSTECRARFDSRLDPVVHAASPKQRRELAVFERAAAVGIAQLEKRSDERAVIEMSGQP